MQLRALFRLAGIFASLGAGACTHQEHPGSGTADGASGGPSTGELPTPDPDPTTTALTTGPDTAASTGGSASTGTGTTGTGEFCGDGMIDGAEECDNGDNNSNLGSCTHKCQKAACGDGYLWEGVEQCDHGMANSFDYGGCRPDDCTWGPRCGDAIVDALREEECDLGDDLNGTGDALEGEAACSATCRWVGRLVFVSSGTYSGSLGGVSGADLKCQALALAIGLTNPYKFRAWISDGVHSPVSHFEQVALTGAPYILRNGRIVAADFDELIVMGPRTGISLTEKGTHVLEEWVWTNTSASGEPFSPDNHCGGWTTNSPDLKARAGFNAIESEQGAEWDTWRNDRLWTSTINRGCDKLAHLYCFEDAPPAVFP
jgi:hypothetical protein